MLVSAGILSGAKGYNGNIQTTMHSLRRDDRTRQSILPEVCLRKPVWISVPHLPKIDRTRRCRMLGLRQSVDSEVSVLRR